MAKARDRERGARIKALRASVGGLTQKGLGEMIGVAQRTVEEWEAGSNITLPNAIELARYFNTTVEHILGPDHVAAQRQVLEGRLADIEGALAALGPDGVPRRPGAQDTREAFAQVAGLISALRDDLRATVTELREGQDQQTTSIEALILEMRELQRRREDPGRSGTGDTSP